MSFLFYQVNALLKSVGANLLDLAGTALQIASEIANLLPKFKDQFYYGRNQFFSTNSRNDELKD
jgi:hypothetical protein